MITERNSNFIPEYLTAAKVVGSVFFTRRGSQKDEEFTTNYRINAHRELKLPVNFEDEILVEFLNLISVKGSRFSKKLAEPYWKPGCQYNPREVFYTAIQFTDDHNEPLPITTIPPEQDVIKYSNSIIKSDKKMNVVDQFKLLLDITENNLVGAANLGFVTSRLYARGSDRRMYPGINIQAKDLLSWNDKLAQFETYNSEISSDAPGDTYYFWTHLFAATSLGFIGTVESKNLDRLFENGTQFMAIARKMFLRQPVTSSHYEASLLGRNIGLAIIDELNSVSNAI